MTLQLLAWLMVGLAFVAAMVSWRRMAGPGVRAPSGVGDAFARMVAAGDGRRAEKVLNAEPDDPSYDPLRRVFEGGRAAWETIRDDCRRRQARIDRLRLIALAVLAALQVATLALVWVGGPALAWPALVLYPGGLVFHALCLSRMATLDEAVDQALAMLPIADPTEA